MGKVILHAGMHKTGSSSIQATLSRASLPDTHRYFSLGEPNHSGPFVNMFSLKPENYHGNVKRGRSSEELAIIKEKLVKEFSIQLSLLGERVGIVSAEDVCNFNCSELSEVKKLIESFGHYIEVFVYIRPPKSYIESALQQIVKGGLRSFEVKRAFPNYKKLENLIEVFGEKNVNLKTFAEGYLLEGDSTADFLDFVGLSECQVTPVRDNQSLSLTAVKALYVFRKHSKGYGVGEHAIPSNNYLISKLSKIEGDKFRVSDPIVLKYYEESPEDVKWINKRLGESSLWSKGNNLSTSGIRCEEDLLHFTSREISSLDAFFRSEGVDFDSARLKDNEYIASLIGKVKASYPGKKKQAKEKEEPVHVGKQGYLFLKGGRHSPFKYLESSSRSELKGKKAVFSNNIKSRKRFCDNKRISYSHLISPDKHYICAEYVGKAIGEKSVAEEFLDFVFRQPDGVDEGCLVYPRTSLSHEPEKSTYRVDTHLKPFGTLLCLKELASNNQGVSDSLHGLDGFQEKDLGKYLKSTGPWEGDLGSKLNPAAQEERLVFNLPEHVSLYSNNISGGNNGICDIYFNKLNIKNYNGGRILIFGDSFARSLAKLASLFAREVVFMRTPHVYPEIINMNLPDVVISQNVERYLPSVIPDRDRGSFFSYQYLEGVFMMPDKSFCSAFNTILSYPRKPYSDFIGEVMR